MAERARRTKITNKVGRIQEMSNFKINFSLKPLDDITPWGGTKPSLHWFGMTDGQLWITVGENNIYEYSQAAIDHFHCDLRYNDYQLSRFLEDFSDTFRFVREPIPAALYNGLDTFRNRVHHWHDAQIGDDDDDDAYWDFFENEYEPLTDWYQRRSFDSGHLVGGPYFSFCRCGETGEKIKICWESDDRLESGGHIWTVPCGVFELPYREFVAEVERFYTAFFEAMDKQVERALQKDWGAVEVDKAYLAKEHAERKEGFSRAVALLSTPCTPEECTDWAKVETLYRKMTAELL